MPGETSASPGQVNFIYAMSGDTQFQLAAVGTGVTKVAVTLGNGTELWLRPTVGRRQALGGVRGADAAGGQPGRVLRWHA